MRLKSTWLGVTTLLHEWNLHHDDGFTRIDCVF